MHDAIEDEARRELLGIFKIKPEKIREHRLTFSFIFFFSVFVEPKDEIFNVRESGELS